MFSKIFIERPKLAMVISIVIMLWGILALFSLPVAEYPEISPPQVVVSAAYSGAGAEVVRDTVAIPLEAEINGVEDLMYFSSSTDNSGAYSCRISFKPGTDSDIAMVNTQNAVKRAEPLLPDDVKRVGVQVTTRGGDILAAFVFKTDGSEMTPMQLSNYVSTVVRDAVGRVDGVGSAEVIGGKTYAMRIWLDPLRMAGLGISTDMVAAAVRTQNVQAAAGTLGAEGGNDYIEYKINVQGRLKTVEEFENIIVRRDADGSVLRLKDIAKVELGAKTYNMRAEANGEEVVGLQIFRANDANALDTIEKVRAVLDDIASRFPAGVSYFAAYDPTKFIKVNVKEIEWTLGIALLLVVFITYLFLQDWRATLIPAVAIPVALLGTFPFLAAFGFSINVLTMFGLILVIGSLVDDAIVVVENTQALMQREGLSAKEAAIKSMTQITGAVIATTLVTLACYVPLAFYGGMVGMIYVQFSVTMCIALCISTFVALTLSPALCSLILRDPTKHSAGPLTKIFSGVKYFLDGTRSKYLYAVKFLVRRSLLTAGILASFFIAIFIMFHVTPTSFLPDEDKGVVMCNIELAPGATISRTNDVIKEFRERVGTVNGIDTVMAVSGMSLLNGTGENNGFVIAQLKPWDERKTQETQLQNIVGQIQYKTATMLEPRIFCFTPPAIMGLGATGGVTFHLAGEGDIDPHDLSVLVKKFSQEIMSLPEASRAMSTYNADTPQLYLDIDREKAELLGVNVGTIFSTLQSQLASYYINDFNILGDSFYVKMQSEQESRETIDNIRDIQIQNVDGDLVPLTSVASLRYTVGPQRIQRFNKLTSAEFTTYAKPGVPSGSLMNAILNLKLPRNYHIEWTGMSYQERHNEGQIVWLLLLAVVFAYLFLVGQYESWSVPVPVMLTVATSVLGALIGIVITGSSLSIYAQLGLVMLIGLAAKNAILMVEFSKVEKERGVPVDEAAVNGANLRFRAVLMTAWSFIFGVLPLVVATGAGSGSRRAIGITTFSGMLMAILVGIIMTPALYAACEHTRSWFGKLRKRNKDK